MESAKLKLYYDGLCHLCSAEISHYRKQTGSEQISFIDITDPAFDPGAEGLDPVKVHREMHARRPDGSLAVGVDAFVAVWETLPRFHWAARLAGRPLPRAVLRAGYAGFARIRPYLPRRKDRCAASPYCESHPKS